MASSIDFLSGLYNKQSCYADRLTEEELESIHIQTPLEAATRKWLLGNKDIVLLGNPGDGKTHLFRRLRDTLDKVRADVILDATAERDYELIVRRWKAARSKRRPFCLAINQGPLNQLLTLHADRLEALQEVQAQSRSLLYYDATPRKPKGVVVLDLNLRSVLSPEIIDQALANLLKEGNFESCADHFADETSDGALNRRALQHPQVRARLVRLLQAAGHLGLHITMRDLQGFLSYLLFGGRPCAEMSTNPSDLQFRYFNLCFNGDGHLFDAMRSVFDPVRTTHPKVDEDLWEHSGLHEGWIFSRPPLTPDHYDDARDQFVALKRQYFFEHQDGELLLRLDEDDDRAFLDLLQSTNSGTTNAFLPRVLQALNGFYCPQMTEDGQALRLWGSQQYDGHPSRVLVSCYRIASDKFSLLLPQCVPWLREAIQYQPDHLLLRYAGKASSLVGLRIDRGLWRALMLASRGMPFALRSPQHAQALETFTAKLHTLEARTHALETAVIFNLGRNQKMQVVVDRQKGQYVQP